VSPDYCGNCRTLNLPCSQGLTAANGRKCPQIEHACRTVEGEALWRAVAQSGGWSGGGMVPRRVDRAAIRARLPGVDGWMIEDLIDAFEPAALAAMAKAEAARKSRASPKRPGARRAPSEGEAE
jgi:hypothetical protein